MSVVPSKATQATRGREGYGHDYLVKTTAISSAMRNHVSVSFCPISAYPAARRDLAGILQRALCPLPVPLIAACIQVIPS